MKKYEYLIEFSGYVDAKSKEHAKELIFNDLTNYSIDNGNYHITIYKEGE